MKATRTKKPRAYYALFESAIGRCGIAWSEQGLLRVQLPEATEEKTLHRLATGDELIAARRPPRIARAIERLVRHLKGDLQDFADLPLDVSGLAPFRRRVYEAARKVPAGRTMTYGELASRIGTPDAARAVGQALGANPFAIVVPCHRILAANGRMGGFSAHGGVGTKARLLGIEGVSPGRQTLPMFDRNEDLRFDSRRAVQHLRLADPKLADLMDRVGPFRLELKETHSSFAMLSEAIVYQQLTGKAAATIFGRFKALYAGRRFPKPAEVLATPDAKLRKAGLSRAKALALKDLAEKVESGVVPRVAVLRRMSDEDIVERLTAVRGIGRWTVEMLLIFRLGRPDVLPTGDYGVRKAFALVFRKRALPSPSALARHGERWRPYRTVASWYLWRALEVPGQAPTRRVVGR